MEIQSIAAVGLQNGANGVHIVLAVALFLKVLGTGDVGKFKQAGIIAQGIGRPGAVITVGAPQRGVAVAGK